MPDSLLHTCMAFSQMSFSWLIEFRNKKAGGRVVCNPHNREGEAEEPQLWNRTGTQRQTLKQRKEERREGGGEGTCCHNFWMNWLTRSKEVSLGVCLQQSPTSMEDPISVVDGQSPRVCLSGSSSALVGWVPVVCHVGILWSKLGQIVCRLSCQHGSMAF